MPFEPIEAALSAFNKLKIAFTSAPMLVYFDPEQQIHVEPDASGFAISAIMLQLSKDVGVWHLMAYWSRKNLAEKNYKMGKSEMLAIVECAKV